MRGILPIYVLITVTTSIIILLSVTAVYYTGFNPFSSTVSIESAKSDACSQEVRGDCKTSTAVIQTEGFDADKDGTPDETAANGDNLFMLCKNYYGVACTTRIRGDANMDCIVDMESDRQTLIDHRTGPPPGPLPYDPTLDWNGDGVIDALDLGITISLRGNVEPAADKTCKRICQCY